MTLERARELLEIQAPIGSFCNGNSAKLIVSEVMREHGQAAVDALIVQTGLDRVFRSQPGTRFVGGVAHASPGDRQ